VLHYFKIYKVEVENQLERKIKHLRSDRGGEYFSNTFNTFCEEHDIVHERTPPYSRQSNRIAKRKNRNVLGWPAWAHFGPAHGLLFPVSVPESSRVFPQLHVGSCRQFLFGLDEAPCPARFGSFLTGSSEFSIFSSLVLIGFLESCLFHCLTCTELQGLFVRCLMNLS
jgi:hypothetical protein